MAFTRAALVRAIAANLVAQGNTLVRTVAQATRTATVYWEPAADAPYTMPAALWAALADGTATEDMDPSGYGSSDWGDRMDAAAALQNYLLGE